MGAIGVRPSLQLSGVEQSALTEALGLTKLSPGGNERLDRRTKKELMARLERDAQRICARFGLRYRVLEPERANVKSRYGVCFSDGTIRIRLRHVTTGRPLKYSSLVSTLCHELAHLKHFNHGLRFRAYYAQILEWCRQEGIYQPGLPAAAAAKPLRQSARNAKAPGPKNSAKARQAKSQGGGVGPEAQGILPVFGQSAGGDLRPTRTRRKKKPDPSPSSQLELFG